MAQRLTWKKLLCEERFRESGSNKPTDYHNEFDKDYSRIVYSSSVRVCGKINLHTIAAQKYITPQAA